jgi:putative protein kinase ArgK-like GTPase of G3E family
MSGEDRPQASTTREERQAELQERIADCRFRINAHVELAKLIETSSATCAGYQVIWTAVADRLRADARIVEKEMKRAQERLADITLAVEAAERFIRNVPSQHPSRIHEH